MPFGNLGLGLGLGAAPSGQPPFPPTGLLVTMGTAPSDAPTGTNVLPLVALDPNLADVHSFAIETNSFFEVADGWVRTKASIASLSGTSPTYDITVTDQTNRSIVVEITISVIAAGSFDDTGDGGLSDASPYYNDGNLIVPRLTQQDGFIQLTGKGGGAGALMIVDIGIGRNYHKLHTKSRFLDLAEMKNGGLDAMMGFGWLDDATGNFHMVGLAGDGVGGIVIKKVYGSGAFNGTTNDWTISNHGAPTHGATFDVDHFMSIALASDGATYDFRTSAAGAVNTWATDISASVPSPFADAKTAPRFGLAVFVPKESRGPVNLKVSLWRENVMQWVRRDLNGAFSITPDTRTEPPYEILAFDTGDFGQEAGSPFETNCPAAIAGRYVQHAGQVYPNGNGTSMVEILHSGTTAQQVGAARMFIEHSSSIFSHGANVMSAPVLAHDGKLLRQFVQIEGSSLVDFASVNNHLSILKPKHFRGALISRRGAGSSATLANNGAEVLYPTTDYNHLGIVSGSHFVIPSSLNGQRIRFSASVEYSNSIATQQWLAIQRDGSVIAYQAINDQTGNMFGTVSTMPEVVSTGQVWRVWLIINGTSGEQVQDTAFTWFSAELVEDFIGAQKQGSGSAQSITGGGGWTKITMLDTTRYNVGGFDLATTDSAIRIPAGVSKVMCQGEIAITSGTNSVAIRIRKNGASYGAQEGYMTHYDASSITDVLMTRVFIAPVTVDDEITLECWKSSTQNAQADFNTKLGVWAIEHKL